MTEDRVSLDQTAALAEFAALRAEIIARGSVALGESMIDSGLAGVVCWAGEVVVSCPVLVSAVVGVRRVPVSA
ncbi:hypothetical protein PSN13_05178 [Micromonospora saelicesensis]|uniref:Uncharacterized protein n=1 Tax=Micromonospora saelicesensis TaxID=285676 RepID=A0A328NHG5_9ACTN|nr:hypothetical protein PSN13_05178 [Micromonospora saelicesensis]